MARMGGKGRHPTDVFKPHCLAKSAVSYRDSLGPLDDGTVVEREEQLGGQGERRVLDRVPHQVTEGLREGPGMKQSLRVWCPSFVQGSAPLGGGSTRRRTYLEGAEGLGGHADEDEVLRLLLVVQRALEPLPLHAQHLPAKRNATTANSLMIWTPEPVNTYVL
jgi:hypothetical protein